MKDKIVLTGGTGFLGYHIAKNLVERNFDVTAIVRSERNAAMLKELGVNIKTGCLNDVSFVNQTVKGNDFIIHCASCTDQFNSDYEIYRKANVESTENLVRASKQFQIKRFVLVSTANCFTNGSLDNPGNENSGFMDFLQHSYYAKSKYLAQKYVLDEFKNNRFPVIVVAPTFLIGPIDTKPSSGKLMLHALKKKVVFYPSKGGKSFVDVQSAAMATINALENGNVGECYLLSGTNQSYKEYFQIIQQFSNRKKYFFPIPNSVVKFVSATSKWVPNQKFKMLSTNLQLLFTENYFSNQKAKEELGMQDTDFESSIKSAYHWFRENQYIS